MTGCFFLNLYLIELQRNIKNSPQVAVLSHEMKWMIFCDLSKVFDKVWHSGLLFELQTYGLCGNLLQWFQSYMCDRLKKLCIKIYCHLV
jgi:hypothetical protein